MVYRKPVLIVSGAMRPPDVCCAWEKKRENMQGQACLSLPMLVSATVTRARSYCRRIRNAHRTLTHHGTEYTVRVKCTTSSQCNNSLLRSYSRTVFGKIPQNTGSDSNHMGNGCLPALDAALKDTQREKKHLPSARVHNSLVHSPCASTEISRCIRK
jgi:hypothetical protein